MRHITPELTLARACAKEEGLFAARGQTEAEHVISLRDGCTGIFQVYKRGAAYSHHSFESFARAYSPHVFEPGGENPWIAGLSNGPHEPALWPGHSRLWMPDRTSRPDGESRWMALLAVANDIYHGRGPVPLEHRCSLPPDHWGGKMDHWRGVANGWIQERCGVALNEFWLVPARHEASDLARLPRIVDEPTGPVSANLARGRRHPR